VTRRAYGCRLNRPAAEHPAKLLFDDMLKAGIINPEDVSERSGLKLYRVRELLRDAIPTPKESEALAPLFGREKRYYHKRGIEWKDENE
jgi:hypothetical protein